MSEPKLISPMLDKFVMGDPISEHDGVQCCPAMEKDSDSKYIVKIISVPATQTKVDALLLSGACSSQEDALSYFNELAESIKSEAQLLEKLSATEGFLPIKDSQIVPMEDGIGYDVYLLSEYRNTLQQTLRRGCMTHLSALNLGLDLCAALSLSRQSGYLYANLKPSNIYMAGENAYRIGDLGFLKLDSLKYTSLPDRYFSQYTAPEITDAYSTLNTTLDVYAAGLILYQVFNGGQLPALDECAPEEAFPPPAYADYEMAEIILKACAANPESRWQDPVEMGQALVAYMQRNGAHDTPIIPEVSGEETVADEEIDVETISDEAAVAEIVEEIEDLSEEIEPVVTEESIYTEDPEGNLTFIEDSDIDETAPVENVEEVDYNEVTEEVSEMLEQADDLIAHDTPEPVVQPEPIDVPIPPPIKPEEESSDEAAKESSQENTDGEETDNVKEDEQLVSEEDTEETDVVVKKKSHWVRNTLLALLALAIIAAGIFFYKTFYLQTIDSMVLETSDDGVLTVLVTSDVPEDKLVVICTDTYGIQVSSPVIDGKAVFNNLTPNSAYTVKIDVNGFHRLTGNTSAAYTTPRQTEIIQFTAVTGSEDGSVILNFAIDGPDSDQWKITYKSFNSVAQTIEFAGHMLTLTNLPIGEELTFTLEPKQDIRMIGINQVVHTVSKIVKAKNITLSAMINSSLTVQWEAPANTAVESWTVRCYNDDFDKTIVAEENTATFEIPDITAGYTIEVTAAGMSVAECVLIAKNSLNVTDFQFDDSDPNGLRLSWKPVGEPDTADWKLTYTVNGSAAQEIPVDGGTGAYLSPVIPGSEYFFALQTADGTAILGGSHSYKTKAAEAFEGYNVSAENITFKLCRTPDWSNWDYFDVSNSDITSDFASDENASLLLRLRKSYNGSNDKITALIVIRNESGDIVNTAAQTQTWNDMWYWSYSDIDLPSLPTTAGTYVVSIYFNGQLAGEVTLNIIE